MVSQEIFIACTNIVQIISPIGYLNSSAIDEGVVLFYFLKLNGGHAYEPRAFRENEHDNVRYVTEYS
ncbi:MAG: hypothetical protein ACI89J_002558 [Hyphomicrobiaceae bacterium]|jgi:hypothetical protein